MSFVTSGRSARAEVGGPSRPASWRLRAAGVAVVAGLAAYNWWVAVPFRTGLLKSANGFFSDLEATGQPDASILQHLDLLAGVLILAALLLRGSAGRDGAPRAEWRWLLVFAVAGAVGGLFPYACTEGTSAACRSLEWRFQLPVHHYLHIASGIVEFATVSIAALLARRRTSGSLAPEARIYRLLVLIGALAYPMLGAAYLTDRLGAFVEPVFFLAFSLFVGTEIFEPAGGPLGRRGPAARPLEEREVGRRARRLRRHSPADVHLAKAALQCSPERASSSIWQSNGLLIRRFSVRVRGGAPPSRR